MTYYTYILLHIMYNNIICVTIFICKFVILIIFLIKVCNSSHILNINNLKKKIYPVWIALEFIK